MTHQPENTGKKAKLPPFPRLSGRLHIFPALIPLAQILPWLLMAVGAAASATQVAFWQRHRKVIFSFAAFCFVAAAGVYLWNETRRPGEVEGSRPVASSEFSVLKNISAAVPYTAKKYEAFGQIWSVSTKSESLAMPVIAGDLMLIGTFDGTIDAHNRADGKLVWSLKKKEPVFTNPSVSGKMVFVGEGLHTAPAATLTAFSLPDGKPVWERQFRSHVESAAALDPENNRLWTPAGEESVWALRMDDGAVLWRQKIGHTDATPLYLDGKLYTSTQPFEKEKTATPETRLSRHDPDTGETEWQVKLDGNSMGSPQPGPKGVILLTSAIGQVGPAVETDQGWSHAVSTDGKKLWSVKLPGLPLPEAAVLQDAGIVIHTLKTGAIIALNALDGSTVWEVKIGKEFLAPATLRATGNPPLLASITKDGTVSIMNALDGIEIRRLNMRQGGYVPPVFDNDVLYITTPRGISAYGGVHLFTRGSN